MGRLLAVGNIVLKDLLKTFGVGNETFLLIKENLKNLNKMTNYSSRNYNNNSLDCPIAYQ